MNKLIALLEEVSGLPKSSLASCVNDDETFNEEGFTKAESKIRSGVEAKLSNAKEQAAAEALKNVDTKEHFDDGFKKGEAKVHAKVEKKLRDIFGVEDSLSGEELWKKVSANKDKAPAKVDPSEIEKQPWFQELLEKKESAHKEALKKLTDDHDAYKKGVSRTERLSKMRKEAGPLIEALNLNLSDDPKIKQNQMEVIWSRLESGDYDFQDGRILVLDSEGKVMKDKMDNTVEFASHITGTATSLFDSVAGKKRESAGVKAEEKKEVGTKWTRDMPKSDAEYRKSLLDESIPMEERSALREAYNA